jgi:hypothetical protein
MGIRQPSVITVVIVCRGLKKLKMRMEYIIIGIIRESREMDYLMMPGMMNVPGMILVDKMIRVQGMEKTLEDMRKITDHPRVNSFIAENQSKKTFEDTWDETLRSANKALRIVEIMEG